jgi:hypothetical protein
MEQPLTLTEIEAQFSLYPVISLTYSEKKKLRNAKQAIVNHYNA